MGRKEAKDMASTCWLSPRLEDRLLTHIDSDYAYRATEALVKMGMHKVAGTESEHKAAGWIAEEMQRIGLVPVWKESFPVYARDISKGALLIVEESHRKEISAVPMPSTFPTRGDGLMAELVSVGYGLANDYTTDVRGKIVLFKRVWPDMTSDKGSNRVRPVLEASVRGAVGAICYDDEAPADAIRTSIFCITPIQFPVVAISRDDAEYLIDLVNKKTRVTVTLRSHIQEPTPSFSHNILGFIMGYKQPDRYIIIGSHYDTWWHGAMDSLAGVGCVLAIAKAMVDSGVKPRRTIVFVAHGAEEQGWPSTWDWLVGSYTNIFVHHPDWAMKVMAQLNIDIVGGFKPALVETTPELYPLVKNTAEDLRLSEVSVYYHTSPSTNLTFTDSGAYVAAGVPTANISYWSGEYWRYYHTRYDDMNFVAKDSLELTSKLWAVTALRLAHTPISPVDLGELGRAIQSSIGANSSMLASVGLRRREFGLVLSAAKQMEKNARKIAAIVSQKTTDLDTLAELIEESIVRARLDVNRNIYIIGGPDCWHMYHLPDPYANDAYCIKAGLRALVAGRSHEAALSLEKVFAMMGGKDLSYETYKLLLDEYWSVPNGRWVPRVQRYVDVYRTWRSLKEKNQRGKTDQKELGILKTRLSEVLSDLDNALLITLHSLQRANRILEDGISRAELKVKEPNKSR